MIMDQNGKRREKKPIAKNRRALHEYEILETYEAGIELTGTEVRSLRENNCQLTDCFALIRGGKKQPEPAKLDKAAEIEKKKAELAKMQAELEALENQQKEGE